MSANAASVPLKKLVNGASIPSIGLGTYPMDDAEAGAAVVHALEAGYRLIDTAENYFNEEGIAEGIVRSGVPRAELFVTTKFNKRWHSLEGVRTAWERSVTRLELEYLDLLLIHWPNPDQNRYVEAWRGLVSLLEEGKVRAIGTSNFTPAQLGEIIDATGVVPDVNQIQHSPLWLKDEQLDFHARHGIVTESWSPLGKGGSLLTSPAVVAAARAHGVTPAQAVLRWHVQRGAVPIPKTTDPARMSENLGVFGFELTDEQVAAIDALDGTGPAAADPMAFGH
ncbi:MAG: aldo/keto reductase [Arthrobacter sp.]|uniref:aldo/keto reductase n=1 Tax=Arthrobacter sp. TaxID=1667 RepID=UPI00346D9BF1